MCLLFADMSRNANANQLKEYCHNISGVVGKVLCLHRSVEVGKNLGKFFSGTPCHMQGQLQQAAQVYIHLGFGYLKVRRLHIFSG